jgi:hypothetical protein
MDKKFMYQREGSEVAEKNQEPEVFSIQKDPATGREIMVPNPTARSITYNTQDLKEWIAKGLIPKELGEYELAHIEGVMETIATSKKLKEIGATQEEILESYKNKKITSQEEFKKSVDLIDFLLKNKEKLLHFLSIFEEKTFRQSREIIDNKLNGERAEKNQLFLFDEIENRNKTPKQTNTAPETIIKGLDLSPAEDRLIHSISLLLSRKSERYDQSSPKYYMGNYETGVISINSIEVETARMVITPHDLYSTYLGRKDYNTDHIKFILGVLNELSKKNFLITLNFQSKSSTEKKKKFDKLRTYLPLFQIAILNHDLTESESQEIDKNEFLIEGKKCHFLFKFGPLFTNNIRDRYVEFPEDIHLRIANSKSAGGKGRIPQCVNLMRDLLFREKQQKRYSISRDEETLVHTLGLSKEWEAGKKGRVLERLNKSFDIFKEIGLIVSIEKTTGSRGQVKYQIELHQDFK